MLASVALVSMVSLLAVPDLLGMRLDSALAECPSRAEVQSALGQVLGDGPASAAGWVLAYERDLSGEASAEDGALAIKLVAPTGERLVDRRITVARNDCPAVASAIAAVVERSLRSVGWTRGEPLPTPAPVAAAPVATLAHDRPPALVIGAGPSLGLSSAGSDTAQGNLLFQVRACARGPLCLRFGTGLLSARDSHSAGDTTAHLTSRFVSVTPLAALLRGWMELGVGPTFLVGLDSATSSLGGSGDRATMAVGLAAAVALRLSPRWRLSVGLEGTHAALAADYVVELDGVRTVLLAPPAWRGMTTAQLEFVPWP
jgi:hypothetical protein